MKKIQTPNAECVVRNIVDDMEYELNVQNDSLVCIIITLTKKD